MTLWAALAGSLLRSILVCVLGVWLAHRMIRVVDSLDPRRTSLFWCALLAPLGIPAVMTGYCYRDTAMSLIRYPWLVEILYAVILLAQAVPAAALILRFAPPPAVSASALHAAQLSAPRGLSYFTLWWARHSRSSLPAAALVFLLTFQEADLAALLRTVSWTEWLFTRNLGGLPLSAALRSALVPLLVQLPLLWGLAQWWSPEREAHQPPETLPAKSSHAAWREGSWIVLSWLVVVLIPSWQLLKGARQGWPSLWQQPSTWREISDALLLAVTAAGIAWGLGAWILRRVARHSRWAVMGLLLCGLPGSLTLGLFLARIFQSPWLLPAYNTPVPLVLGMTLVQLPRAVVLLTILSRMRAGSGAHVLHLLTGSAPARRQLAWRVRGQGTVAALALLCGWGYLEVMLPSILAPPGMVPVGLLLYNSLHYGSISALAAKLLLALLVPAIPAALFLAIKRFR